MNESCQNATLWWVELKVFTWWNRVREIDHSTPRNLIPVGRLVSIGKNPAKAFLSWEPPESPKWFQRECQACLPHRWRTAYEVKASTLLRGLAAETFGKTKGKDGFHGTQKIFLGSFFPHSSSRVLKESILEVFYTTVCTWKVIPGRQCSDDFDPLSCDLEQPVGPVHWSTSFFVSPWRICVSSRPYGPICETPCSRSAKIIFNFS